MLCRLLIVLACCLGLGSEAHATQATVNATITVFAAIAFSPNPVAFGIQQTGTSVTHSLTVTNNGQTAASFSVSLVPAVNSTEFSLSPLCSGALASASSCQISVTFTPTADGAASAGVKLTGATRNYTVSLSGTGTSVPIPTPASIALSPSNIQIQDNATGGSIASRATVTMSDGSTAASCTLSTSDTAYYQISGMNIVLAHDLSSADDGQHNTDIAVVSCP